MQPSTIYSVYKRKGRPYYYVKYRNTAGEYLSSAICTGTEDRAAALNTAYQWMIEGIPQKEGEGITDIYQLRAAFQKADLSTADADFFVKDLQRRGLIGGVE